MHGASEVGIGIVEIGAAAAGAAGADDSDSGIGIGTAAECVGEEIAEGVYLGGSTGQWGLGLHCLRDISD